MLNGGVEVRVAGTIPITISAYRPALYTATGGLDMGQFSLAGYYSCHGQSNANMENVTPLL